MRADVPEEDGHPDKLLMAIYHHIHHLERAHGTRRKHSVLLDLTRARVAEHYAMDPSEMQLPYPDAATEGIAAERDVDLVDVSSSSSTSQSKQHRRLLRQHRPRPLSAGLPSAFKPAMKSTETSSRSASGSQPHDMPEEEVEHAETLSRALASSPDFGVEAAWDEEESGSHSGHPDLDTSSDDPQCMDLCKCLASELLFGITKGVLPYTTNHKAEKDKDDPSAPEDVFEFRCAPDTTPLWYRKYKKQDGEAGQSRWSWTPSDPEEGHGMFASEWQTCGSDDVEGGVWGAVQAVGLTDVAVENKFMLQLLHDFDPGDNDGKGAPEGSNPKRYDAKEDLRVCSARLKQAPSRQCRCKKSQCVKNMVRRYFQYIQIAENAVGDRAKQYKEFVLDSISVGLDILGMIDPFGIIADLMNAGLAAAREEWIDAVLGVVAAIPVLGTVFAPLKWIEKGVIVAKGKFAKWGRAMIDGLMHPKLLDFVKDLGEKAASGDGAISAVQTAFKAFGKVLEKVSSTIYFMLERGEAVFDRMADIIGNAGSKPLEAFHSVQKKVGAFMTDILTRVGCFSNVGAKIASWGLVLFEKVATGLGIFPAFSPVTDWMTAVAPCVKACASDGDPDEIMDEVSTCVLEAAGAFAQTIDPCWGEGGDDKIQEMKDQSSPLYVPSKPKPEKLSKIEQQIDAEIDAGTRKCKSFDHIFGVPDGEGKLVPLEDNEGEIADEIPQELIEDADEYEKEQEAKRLSSKGVEVNGVLGSIGGKIVFKDGWMPVGVTVTADGKTVESVDDAQDALLEKISEDNLLKEGEKLVEKAQDKALGKLLDKTADIIKKKTKNINVRSKSVQKGWEVVQNAIDFDRGNCSTGSGSESGGESGKLEDGIGKASSMLDDDSSTHTRTQLERKQIVLEREGEALEDTITQANPVLEGDDSTSIDVNTAGSARASEDGFTAAHSVVEDDKNTEAIMAARTPLVREQRALENEALAVEEQEMSTRVDSGGGEGARFSRMQEKLGREGERLEQNWSERPS